MAFGTPDSGPYLSKLGMKNETYTIKDAWARSEIAEIENAIEGGTHFRGVLTTGVTGNTITDNENVKDLYVGASPGTKINAADQTDGDIFIYNKDGQNLEFIVANGKYSELGSAGSLGAFAFADTGTGSFTVPLSSSITLNSYTPQVSKGTLGLTYQTNTVTLGSTTDSASGTFSPAAITIPSSTVTVTPTSSSYRAFADTTYDSNTATLTILETNSVEFLTGVSASVPSQKVTPDSNQNISVSYTKALPFMVTTISEPSITGDLAVTAAAPTATITNPTITVTVAPAS